jgi:hypothetical protein
MRENLEDPGVDGRRILKSFTHTYIHTKLNTGIQ